MKYIFKPLGPLCVPTEMLTDKLTIIAGRMYAKILAFIKKAL